MFSCTQGVTSWCAQRKTDTVYHNIREQADLEPVHMELLQGDRSEQVTLKMKC
jgi:hypothetical protein